MNESLPTIQPGTVIRARSVCDASCIFEAKVIARKGSFVTVNIAGSDRTVKVRRDDRDECCYALGRYSMAPLFRP